MNESGEVKIRITSTDQRCRKCNGQIIRKNRNKSKHKKKHAKYYFSWWLECVGCHTQYFQPEARVDFAPVASEPSLDMNLGFFHSKPSGKMIVIRHVFLDEQGRRCTRYVAEMLEQAGDPPASSRYAELICNVLNKAH